MNRWDFDDGFFCWLGSGEKAQLGGDSRISLLLMAEALDSAYPILWIRMRQLVLDLSGNLDAPL